MSKGVGYEPVLSGRASTFLLGLTKRKQKQVVALLFQLSAHPAQVGDYATRDDSGREIQHLGIGSWHVSYWPDHAAKELRIVEIANL